MATRFTRMFMAVLILAVLALSIPASVSAAALPSFKFLSVKADESVTVRAQSFPANVDFTVRMDVAGNMAIDGIVVKEFNSGSGGSFDATYTIPAELKGKKTIAIRFESSKGYYTYDWFNNKTQTFTTTSTGSTSTGGSPTITITGVDKNDQITVTARNLPSNTDFKVRVGPFYSFSKKGEVTQTFNSGQGGTVVFNVKLPDVVKDVDLIAIRIDGGGRFAYNAFTNENSGSLSSSTTHTSAPAGYSCSIVSVSPSASLSKGADFDAVWEVKNTGSKDWDASAMDYKYISGTKMHQHESIYDLSSTVKSGEKVKIIVDMVAPNTIGTYQTSWALAMGSTNVCTLALTVRTK